MTRFDSSQSTTTMADSTPLPLEQLTIDAFRPLVGATFQMRPDAATAIPMQLVEAEAQPYGRPGFRTPFSLVFRAPMSTRLPQRIYAIEGAPLGTLECFLVPIGPDGQGMRYQAIFS